MKPEIMVSIIKTGSKKLLKRCSSLVIKKNCIH